MLVVGAKEAEQQAVSYRDRTVGDLGAMPLAQGNRPAQEEEVDARTVPPVAASTAPAAAEDGGEQHTY